MLVSSQPLIGFLTLDLDDLLGPYDLVWIKWKQCHLAILERIIHFLPSYVTAYLQKSNVPNFPPKQRG